MSGSTYNGVKNVGVPAAEGKWVKLKAVLRSSAFS